MNLEEIAFEVANCSKCPLNSGTYDSGLPVPGVGVGDPNVLLIGEAPGETESLVGKPFQGRAGMCLQAALEQLEMNNFFVTNIVKHRPPKNATPSSEIRLACSHFLRRQIQVINPKAILALGKSAALGLAEITHTRIPDSKLRGHTFFYQSDNLKIPVICTWHPSYIIRGNYTAFEDLKEDLTLLKTYQALT